MHSRTAVSLPLALGGSPIAPTAADAALGPAHATRPFSASAPKTRPVWGRLYAILPVTAALSLAVHLALPVGAWQVAGEYGVAAVTLLLFVLWMAADRYARPWVEPPAGSGPIRVLCLCLPPSPPPLPVAEQLGAPRVHGRLPGEPAAPSPTATFSR